MNILARAAPVLWILSAFQPAAHAQAPAFTLGFVSQNGPISGQAGFSFAAGFPIFLLRGIALLPSLEFARLHHVGDDITICDRLPDGSCLNPPPAESFLTPSMSLAIGPHLESAWFFLGAGPALIHSLTSQQAGVRTTFFTPQVEGGVQARTGIGFWSVSLRWRRLDRWRPIAAKAEYSVLLTYRPLKLF